MTSLHKVEVEGHFFQSWRHDAKWQPWTALCELIDNSIDARAKNIDVVLDEEKNTVQVIDDGVGCDDVRLFFRIGGTRGHDVNGRIGRYGIGGFKAACWLCDWQHVRTVHRGIERSGAMHFTREISSPGEPQWEQGKERGTKNKHGTHITLHGLRCGSEKPTRHPLFGNPQQDKLRSELGMTYGPALRSGALVIRINGEAVAPVAWPQAIGAPLEFDGDYEDLRFSLTAFEVNQRREVLGQWQTGIYIECMGRLICDMTPTGKPRAFTDGLDEFLSTPAWICVRLSEANGQWPLSPDKTDIVGRAVFLESLLEMDELRQFLAAIEQKSIEVDALAAAEEMARLAAAVFGGEANIREKREPASNQSGTVIPIESGRKRRKAEVTNENEDGSVEMKKQGLLWTFTPKHMGSEGTAVAVKVSTPKGLLRVNVDLNLDIDHVAKNWRTKTFQHDLLAFVVPPAVFEANSYAAQRFYALAFSGMQIPMEPDQENLMQLASAILARAAAADESQDKRKRA